MAKMYSVLITIVTSTILLMFLALISQILPDSPFQSILSDSVLSPFAPYLKNINYFLPVGEVIAVMESWVMCMGYIFIYKFTSKVLNSMSSLPGLPLSGGGGSVK